MSRANAESALAAGEAANPTVSRCLTVRAILSANPQTATMRRNRSSRAAAGRLGDVRDNAVLPASDLVAEQPKATGRARSDRTLGDDAALAALAPNRCLLNHKPPVRDPHLERRVVEVAAIAVCQPRREPFEERGIRFRPVQRKISLLVGLYRAKEIEGCRDT
jgi:hypothetical protein